MSAIVSLPLLVSRREAATMLACSVKTLTRMEDDRRLTAVHLRPGGSRAQVRYRRDEVESIACGGMERSNEGTRIPAASGQVLATKLEVVR